MNTFTRSLTIIVIACMVLTLPTMEGKQNGIHNQAGSGCSCHYSGGSPTLSENFPSTYTAGQTYNIQISVSGGVSGSNGGFNVVVDKGTLSTPVPASCRSRLTVQASPQHTQRIRIVRGLSIGRHQLQVAERQVSTSPSWQRMGTAQRPVMHGHPPRLPSLKPDHRTQPRLHRTSTSATCLVHLQRSHKHTTTLTSLQTMISVTPDGDAESGTQIRWLKGGVEVAQHNDINLLNQGATSIGDIWTLTITPSDGTDLGAKVTSSNSVEIIDYDADGDGYGDQSDAFPNDSNEWADSDSDGVGDNADAFDDDNTQTTDSDGDGYGDNASGNNPDAFPNDANEWLDSDNDGVGDNADAFPNDPTETVDSDSDGVGDNADAFPNDASETTDSDNDGVGNNADAFPNDPTETVDSDSDGVGDNADAFPNDASETADSDLDGVGDNADAFPNDASETMDSDGDNVGDNADAFPNDPTETMDSDGDMVGDNADVFPNDATETSDADEDMIGDNADTDDDNDGLLDTEEATIGTDPFDEDTDGDEVNDKDDALPLDASETMDTDGDGTGDNADTDDDNDGLFDLDELSKGTDRLDPDSDDDGVLDGADVFPMDATETMDSDNDGVGDNADAFPNDPLETVDTDADGVGDNADAFPEDASETMDSDGDGMGDNEQKELEDEAAARMQLMIIIGVVLVLAAVGGLLFMRRKNGDSMEPKETTPLPQADPIQPTQQMYATSTPEPVQPMVAEPTVENQWTDENGHTWRRMSDGSTLWWNGTDWQQV